MNSACFCEKIHKHTIFHLKMIEMHRLQTGKLYNGTKYEKHIDSVQN